MDEAVQTLHITVAHTSGSGQTVETALALPAGSTVSQALQAIGLTADPALLGVWGRKAAPEQPLREGDRVEIYRPLKVDPKLARRQRFAQQGTRSAGLFATRRPDAKPGY